MSDVIVYGPALSTYVRTVRMACAEKGIPHKLEEVDFHSEGYRSLHPFNKIPAFRHDGLTLYETGAIGRYIDRTFDGPALQPKDSTAVARQDQWMSAVSDYVYQVMIRELVWQRLVVPMQGGKPNEQMIKDAVPKLAYQLGVIEKALAGQPYLAGDTVSLADLTLFPIMSYVKATPEGQKALEATPGVRAWYDRIAARPSASATDPSTQH